MRRREAVELAIVGTGKAGSALGRMFWKAGVSTVLISREHRKASRPRIVRAQDEDCPREVSYVLLAVPDSVISEAAQRMLDVRVIGPASLVGHLSGFEPSAILSPPIARSRVFSAHPLAEFPGAVTSGGAAERFAGIEAPSRTVERRVKRLFERIGFHSFRLDPAKKPLYHTAAVMAANMPHALLAASARWFRIAEVPDPLSASRKLMLDAQVNATAADRATGLSGPFRRGDARTIAGHIEAIRTHDPRFLEMYVAVGRVLLDLVRSIAEPERNPWPTIEQILNSANPPSDP